MTRARPYWALAVLAGAALMAAPWLGVGASWTRELTLISIYTLVVSGLNLSFGYAGELALGHVALFAAGAYVGGMLAVRGWDTSVALVAAACAAAVVGLISGVPGLRLGGWGLAMASFFLVILVPDVVGLFSRQTGGLIGLQGIPTAKLFGHLLTARQYYLLATGLLCLVVLLLRNVVTSRHGGALRVLRQSPVLASSLGISVYRLKMTAYLVGAIPAGIAGCLFAYLDHFVAPDFFGFDLAIAVIAASVLGGSESIYGAFVGAALLQLGPLRSTAFQKYALIAYGAFLVLGGVLLSGGLAGLLGRAGRRVRPRPSSGSGQQRSETAADSRTAMDPLPGEQLEVHELTKEFDGVRALDQLTLTAAPGRITGLIGPNGCGKTTLLNVVSGFYRPTRGEVTLGGDRLSGMSPHRIARRGVARTFQTPLIPTSMSTLETVAAARYAADYVGLVPAMLRLPRFRRRRSADAEQARRMLALLDIEHLAGEPASSLPLGSRRLVEVARALAANPAVLLLDEPAAGLDEADLDHLAGAIRRVRDAGGTVVLVEHNFRLVCDLADDIYVLQFGKLIASGPPDHIQNDEAVARSYIGQLTDSDVEPASQPG